MWIPRIGQLFFLSALVLASSGNSFAGSGSTTWSSTIDTGLDEMIVTLPSPIIFEPISVPQ